MVINNIQKMIEYLNENPGKIDVISNRLLNQELNKRANGKKSEVLDLLEKQKKCFMNCKSPKYIRNNEYLFKQYLKSNPGKIGVIGKDLFQSEIQKRKNGEKSEILDIFDRQDKSILYVQTDDSLFNNEYIILQNLTRNPGRIGSLGKELFEKELEKRKNGQKSEILDLFDKQGVCTLVKGSYEHIRNNEDIFLRHLETNPGEISYIGEELLNKELEKRKNGQESKILDLLEKQGKCRTYNDSYEYIMNNEYLILENLKANPGRVGVIGEKLLNQEVEKIKNGQESKIFNLLEQQKQCLIYTNSLDYIRNNEYLILQRLKCYPGKIGVIGEELFNKELEKRKNGDKSEILDLLDEQKKCTIFKDSMEYLKNNEYIIMKHLEANPGKIEVIGEQLLNQELEKRKNGDKSEILDLLEKQGKCTTFNDSPEFIMNNEYLILENLKANPGRIGVIGEKLLNQEVEKIKNGQESQILSLLDEQSECLIYNASLDYIRNNEYLILQRLKKHPGRIGVIGEKLLKQEIEKKQKGEKSEILDFLEEQGKCTLYSDSPQSSINNEYLVLENIKANPGRIGIIGEQLLNQELEKRKNGNKSEILDLIDKQKKCYIYDDSGDYLKNNEELFLKFLQTKPGHIGVIGEQLLNQELEKRRDGKQSKIFDLLENQGSCILYNDYPDYILNNEYLIKQNLIANNGRISVIGEKLLNEELEKRKNGQTSELLDLFESHKKCNLFETSSKHIKNNEYIISKYLEFESSIDMGLIGEELLALEVAKGFSIDSETNEQIHNSEIINKLLELNSRNSIKIENFPEVLRNNVELMKHLINKNIINLNYLNEETFEKIWKDEEIQKNARENFTLKPGSTEFIRNNEELINISLNNKHLTLNYVGEKHFDEYLKQYEGKFYIWSTASEFVKKHPAAISCTVKNKPAHFSYIDQDIINSEFEKVTNGEESKLFEQLATSLNVKDKEQLFDTMKKLHEKNNSIFINLNVNLLKDKYAPLSPYLNLICDDNSLQEQITSLAQKNKNNINMLGKVLRNITKYNDNISNKDLYADIINGMQRPEYEELLKDLGDKELDDEDIEKLGWLLCNENYFSIKTHEDVQNLDSTINKVCDEIMTNPEGNFEDYPLINKMQPIYRMANAFMHRSGYMMGINEAIKMTDMFLPMFEGLDETVLTEEELAICTELKNFEYMRNLSEDDAKTFFKEVYKMVSEEKDLKTYKAESYQTSTLCNLASRLYNEKCYEPSKNEKIDSVVYEGEDIPIYNAGTDFSMIIHAVGAYSNGNDNESYKKSWNRAETKAHGFSTSYIGDRMLGTARIENVVYGFNNIENGGFIASAPWDIASNVKHGEHIPVQSLDTLNKLSKGKRIKVLTPEEQLNNTRHTHNEILLERYIIQEDGSLEKRQPNYVVYFTDNYEKENAEKDNLWIETKKAAKEFGVPIVVVEREKCAQKESEEIEKLLKDSKENNNIKGALEALNRIQTNIAGCREYHVNVQIEYFPESKTGEILESVKEILKKDIEAGDNEKFKNDYELASKFEEEEKKKWEITGLIKRTEYEGYDHELFQNELKEIYEQKYLLEEKAENEQRDDSELLESERKFRKSIEFSNKKESRRFLSVRAIGKRTVPVSRREDRDVMKNILDHEEIEKQEKSENEIRGVTI